jgi:hypothetical protein
MTNPMKTMLAFAVLAFLQPSFSQGSVFDRIAKDAPPYLTPLLEWGQRPEWSLDGKYIYFLPRDFSDVFRYELETGTIYPVTTHFYHHTFNRVLCMGNGDLLLLGPETFDPTNPWEFRHKLRLFVLKAPYDKPAIMLDTFIDEGPAVSKVDSTIAWTLPGQREIKMARIEYDEDGKPFLDRERMILSFDHLGQPMSHRLETQNFMPGNEELVFTYYRGTEEEPFYYAYPYMLNVKTGTMWPLIDDTIDGYNEAEGVSNDGTFMLVESDRHTKPMSWSIDVYLLKLDGSRHMERLLDWNTRFPGGTISDNPVVSPDDRKIVVQLGFLAAQAGQGRGMFLFDLDKYEEYKKSK